MVEGQRFLEYGANVARVRHQRSVSQAEPVPVDETGMEAEAVIALARRVEALDAAVHALEVELRADPQPDGWSDRVQAVRQELVSIDETAVALARVAMVGDRRLSTRSPWRA